MQSFWRGIHRAACFGALLLLGAAMGCSPGKGTVSGLVTGPDGQPLPLGRITFLPSSGSSGVTADIQDGKYTAENVPVGETKVAVETSYVELEAKTALKNSNRGQGTGGGPPPKNMPPEAVAGLAAMNKNRDDGIKLAKDKLAKYREIPEKFTDPKTSGLSLTVKSGGNTFAVDLSKK